MFAQGSQIYICFDLSCWKSMSYLLPYKQMLYSGSFSGTSSILHLVAIWLVVCILFYPIINRVKSDNFLQISRIQYLRKTAEKSTFLQFSILTIGGTARVGCCYRKVDTRYSCFSPTFVTKCDKIENIRHKNLYIWEIYITFAPDWV